MNEVVKPPELLPHCQGRAEKLVVDANRGNRFGRRFAITAIKCLLKIADGKAIMGVMGGNVAAADVDPRNRAEWGQHVLREKNLEPGLVRRPTAGCVAADVENNGRMPPPIKTSALTAAVRPGGGP